MQLRTSWGLAEGAWQVEPQTRAQWAQAAESERGREAEAEAESMRASGLASEAER